jgi:hypothetical protein
MTAASNRRSISWRKLAFVSFAFYFVFGLVTLAYYYNDRSQIQKVINEHERLELERKGFDFINVVGTDAPEFIQFKDGEPIAVPQPPSWWHPLVPLIASTLAVGVGLWMHLHPKEDPTAKANGRRAQSRRAPIMRVTSPQPRRTYASRSRISPG